MNDKKSNSSNEWFFQWDSFFEDKNYIEDNFRLFNDWIFPVKIEEFKDKTVLDCGCGKGQHLKFLLPYIKRGVGVDINTSELAKNYINSPKVDVVSGDIATVKLQETFDIVYSIGVLHHTDDPTVSFNHIKSFARKGGKVIVWVYAWEGNFLNRCVLEPVKRAIFFKMNRKLLLAISFLATLSLYPIIYSIYLLPLKFLPFYKYFSNFRKISFSHNLLNVFDKMNAPQTHFIKNETINQWFNTSEFSDIHISPFLGVSWRASGTVK